ncbi:DUF3991 and TOPRIM domain-containing protein [Lignipirellula cremea]|uniref:Toprim domain-containing protein n=1 Tax=Lignipirellula cremea TaxID=2528010 RepID=A0A518E3J1_9BACT|nr:DUF3991 and TOPRIM domain-containing protein [Lignipirellula cremea]QDU98613.1 hypothetical protein Pla8534_64840 [Lignipirellula cremea]
MGISGRSDELNGFKTQINLCEFAADRGFVLDRRHSSRSSAVMRHPSGDKIIVARAANRHWIYFNVHDDRDQGTIIDFLQYRDRLTLGGVRKALRSWTGGSSTANIPTQPLFEDLVPSEHDAGRVLATWMRAQPIPGAHAYLEQRHISRQVLADPIFADRIRIDGRRNALFPHWNSDAEICGFEVKNAGFTGFAPGGVKGLWASRPRPNDCELYICETAIDALSAAQLFGTERKRFLSTAGQVSPYQSELLRSAATKMPPGSTILLATDNDPAGRKLAYAIQTSLAAADLPDKQIVTRLPEGEGADWNDVLRQRLENHPAVPPALE